MGCSDNDSHLLSNADTCLDRAYPPIDIIVALKGAFDVPFEDVDANFLLRKYGFNPDDVREETVPITTTNFPLYLSVVWTLSRQGNQSDYNKAFALISFQ